MHLPGRMKINNAYLGSNWNKDVEIANDLLVKSLTYNCLFLRGNIWKGRSTFVRCKPWNLNKVQEKRWKKGFLIRSNLSDRITANCLFLTL